MVPGLELVTARDRHLEADTPEVWQGCAPSRGSTGTGLLGSHQ